MIKNMADSEKEAILQVADMMVLAAKTSPKGSGKDTVEACVVTGAEKDSLRDMMIKIGEASGSPIFSRDAGCVDKSTAVVLLGCKDTPFGMSGCSMCGFENCSKMKQAGSNCVFNVTDLGIATGSAVSIAADHRIDNRVMYTIGRAALKLGYLSDKVTLIWGIPLASSSKSIFFDRGPGAVIECK